MLRGDLHEVLLESVGDVPLRLGTTVAGCSDAGPVRVRFTDGTADEYDLVVGADGVRSQMRRQVLGGSPARDLGRWSWRFVVDGQPETSSWTVLLGRDRAFLTVPLGSGRTYCYADAPSTPDNRGRQRLPELFAGFGGPAREVLSGLDAAADVHEAPIQEVRTPRWTGPGRVLVGDAAHGTSPNMAQGAAMALEDGLVLSECLATEPLEDALAAYERRRRTRVGWVHGQTHRRDRTRALPRPVRDLVLRTAGARLYRANYRPLLAAP
jgi:2-polyprenyl-6-methoxyphenol hydroxylase-like FAD-dependent oxidoreductase